MARNLTIFTIFKAKDQVTKPIRDMSGQMQRTGRASKNTGMKVKGMFSSFLGANLAFAALNKVRAGLSVVKQEFIDFDQAITAAGAKFGDSFKRGTKGAEQLRKVARQIGAETEFSATQAAQGLDFLAMAGFNAEQSMALLPGVVNLATSTQQDLARSSDIASDALGAFGLMTDDSAQLAENFNRVLDVMSKTTVTSNTNMETLFEAVQKGAPTFTTAGQSVETFNALIGDMANSGVKGAEAGTQLRNMMLRLADPTKESQGVLNQLGIQIRDSNGNFRDAIDILADFEKGTKNMGTAQKTAALSTVFGARTVNGINVLLKDGSDKLRAYRDQLIAAKGSSKELADEMRKSVKNSIEKIKSALIELGFKFIDVFGNKIQLALNGISKLTDKVNEWVGVNQKIIQQGFDKVIGFISEKLKILFDIVSQIIVKFKQVGQEQNTFTNLGKAFTSLKNTLDVIFSELQNVWNILSDSGVIDFIIAKFNSFINTLRIGIAVIRILLKPLVFIFKVITKIMKPFISMLTGIEKLKGGALGGIADLLEGKKKEPQPKSTEARLRRQGVNTNSTNTTIDKNQLDINFNNMPENTSVNKAGNYRNINLNTGANR